MRYRVGERRFRGTEAYSRVYQRKSIGKVNCAVWSGRDLKR